MMFSSQLKRLGLLALCLMLKLSAFAQRSNEFSIWGGASPQSATLFGYTEDAKFALLGLRYMRLITANNQVALKYTIDAIPAAVLDYPATEYFFFNSGGQPVFSSRIVRRCVTSAGLAPIGLQLNLRPQRKWQPLVGLNGGFLYFRQLVPNFGGKQFNFTAELNTGVQVFTSAGKAVTIGYKYHHISNANRGVFNPGFDSNGIHVGFSWFR